MGYNWIMMDMPMTPAQQAKRILTMLARAGHVHLASRTPTGIWKELDLIEARIAKELAAMQNTAPTEGR